MRPAFFQGINDQLKILVDKFLGLRIAFAVVAVLGFENGTPDIIIF